MEIVNTREYSENGRNDKYFYFDKNISKEDIAQILSKLIEEGNSISSIYLEYFHDHSDSKWWEIFETIEDYYEYSQEMDLDRLVKVRFCRKNNEDLRTIEFNLISNYLHITSFCPHNKDFRLG